MKKLFGALLVLIVLILAAYYGMGYLTEKKIKQDLAIVNQSNGLAVDLKSYHRGWFKSIVNFDLHLHPPQKLVRPQDSAQLLQTRDFKVQMPVTIYHGPIIFANKQMKLGLGYAHTDLPFPKEYDEQFNQLFTTESVKPHLVLNFLLSYLGNSTIDFHVPAFKLLNKLGNMNIDWAGMTVVTHIASDLNHVKGNIGLEGLNLIINKLHMVTSKAESQYRLYQTEKPELLLGEADLILPSLKLTESNQPLIELEQFKLHSNSDVKKDLFNLSFNVSAEKMRLRDEYYNQSNFNFAIRNLDAETVAKIENQLRRLQQEPDAQRQGAVFAILTQLPALLNKGPELEISNLSFVTSEGQVTGSLKLNLPNDVMANPLDVTQAINGQAKLKIPGALVKSVLTEAMKEKLLSSKSPSTQAAQTATESNIQAALQSADTAKEAIDLADKQILALLENGFLKEEGAYYATEVTLNQGKFLVNGKPFDINNLKV